MSKHVPEIQPKLNELRSVMSLTHTVSGETLGSILVNRPKPFAVSYHGDSTILVDGDGHWVTGQIPRDKAKGICQLFNELAAIQTLSTFLQFEKAGAR